MCDTQLPPCPLLAALSEYASHSCSILQEDGCMLHAFQSALGKHGLITVSFQKSASG